MMFSHEIAFSDSKPDSIESVLNKLLSSGLNVSVIVNMPNWNRIPHLIRDWDGKDESTMMRLLDEMSRVLTLISDSDLPLSNKRLLQSSLPTLSQSPTLPKQIHTRIGQCLFLLDSVPDGSFVLVETEEFQRMEQSLSDREQRSSEMTQQINELKDQIAQAEREKENSCD